MTETEPRGALTEQWSHTSQGWRYSIFVDERGTTQGAVITYGATFVEAKMRAYAELFAHFGISRTFTL